ncbi:hypothetical protein B0H11DRAFT_2189365 [Mycena galericulata]|nr:hypothetical protein B0H11DRAFT_2189365 [Mycena galericulata]
MCIISDQSRRRRKSPTSGFGCFPQVTIPSIPFKPVSSSFARPQTFIKVLIVKVLFLGAVSVKAWKTVSRHLPSGPHIPIQSSSLPVYRYHGNMANPKNFVGFIGKMVGCIRRSSPTCFLVLCNEFSRLGRLQGNKSFYALSAELQTPHRPSVPFRPSYLFAPPTGSSSPGAAESLFTKITFVAAGVTMMPPTELARSTGTSPYPTGSAEPFNKKTRTLNIR